MTKEEEKKLIDRINELEARVRKLEINMTDYRNQMLLDNRIEKRSFRI